MYASRGLRKLTLALLLAGNAGGVSADTLVAFNFDDDDGAFTNQPTDVHAALGAGGWVPITGTVSDFQGNPGRALAARNFASGNALVLNVSIDTGLAVTLDGFTFDQLASSSGPSNWSLRINGELAASGATTDGFTTATGDLALTGLTDLLSIELAGFDASSNNGTFRLDNFVLSGQVSAVPIVPGVLLLGSGLVAMRLPRRAAQSGTSSPTGS